MSKKEIEDFVKLRVSNTYLFSGKRNTSMWAWRYANNLKFPDTEKCTINNIDFGTRNTLSLPHLTTTTSDNGSSLLLMLLTIVLITRPGVLCF